MKNKNKNKIAVHDHPGRPRYAMKYPRSAEWTFTQLMAANGVETDKGSKRFGKGDNCTMLTLRKNLEADMYFHKDGDPCISKHRTRINASSQVCLVEGVTAEPNSELGLGRRALLYRLRSVPAKDHSADKAPRKAKVNTKAMVAKAIEDAKAILAEPAAVVTIAPAPEAAPVIPTAPAHVAETVPTLDTAPVPEVEVVIANETPVAPVETAPVVPTAEPVAA